MFYKELDNENGLNWYDFHVRLYEPVLCRWHTPDPAQQYVSPYMAMGDDPVNRIDPNGMEDSNHAFARWLQMFEAENERNMRQRSKDFAEQYPGANSGNIDLSAGYWGQVFNNGGGPLGGGGAGGAGGGARTTFTYFSNKEVVVSDGNTATQFFYGNFS